MIRIQYKCTLLADLVLTSRAATEGFQKSLDYIPGAKFLGLVAGKLYDTTTHQQRTLNLFHNGSTRFGNAYPYLGDQILYPVPATWFYPKDESRESNYYLYEFMSPQFRAELTQKGIQLKQSKEGFIHLSEEEAKTVYKIYNIGQNFSIKSAYDRNNRRSMDSKMYGYFALPKGTVWSFFVDIDHPEYQTDVHEALVNGRRLGRSKSAEYGRVKIEKIGELTIKPPNISSGEIKLYALSNWCFYDSCGNCTVRPTPAQLGLPAGSSIIWGKSQIRSRMYRTWNQKRQNRDADRLIIEKGSVFHLHLSEDIDGSVWVKGIGAHRAEGFGQVIANPEFLNPDEKQYAQVRYPVVKKDRLPEIHWQFSDVKEGENDDVVWNFVKAAKQKEKINFELLKLVNEFIDAFYTNGCNYCEISNSQWGQIRRLAKQAKGDHDLRYKLFDPKEGFVNKGQSQSIWRKNGRKVHLENYLFGQNKVLPQTVDSREFLMKLAAEMAKTPKPKFQIRGNEA